MELKIKYEYEEGYLPTKRHRKLQYREVEEEIIVTIIEITKQEAPIALITTTNEWRKVNNNTDLIPVETEYRLYNNEFYTKFCDRYGELESVDSVKHNIKNSWHYRNESREDKQKHIIEEALKYLIINNEFWKKTGEPRYVINTFGLGHNHGGTGLFVENSYNSNIHKKRYFNALQRETVIKEANRIASNRGDTNDVGKFEESCNIKVLIPEAVKCNPQLEHGEGDDFINQLEAITESCSSANEAGLLGLCVLASKLNETE